MATASMNNLTTLIKRLEAATSRLEDIATSTANFDTAAAAGDRSTMKADESYGGASRSGPGAAEDKSQQLQPPSIVGFEELVNGHLQEFVTLSDRIGDVVAEQAAALSRAFAEQKQILVLTTLAKKPEIRSEAYSEVLKGLQTEIGAVTEIRETNSATPWKNHLSMVSDGSNTLGWIAITDSKPADFIIEFLGGAQLYGNRVLKDKNTLHSEWVQAFYRLCNSLASYVRQHHSGGVAWNQNGIEVLEALRQLQSGQASTRTASTNDSNASPSNTVSPSGATSGAPPPPPPPPPPLPKFDTNQPLPPIPTAKNGVQRGSGDMGSVFDEINKGEGVTSGLRKVDKSQMTHKNPSLRTNSAVPARAGSNAPLAGRTSPVPRPKPESMRTKKPERMELDGNKWIVENFDTPSAALEISTSLSQSILVSRCKNTTIRVIGKANAIAVDNSPRLSFVLDSLVSSIEVIKSPNFALQVLGTVPTVLLDQVDGAQLYLSPESVGKTEVFTSKCSGINVYLPPREDVGEVDYKECSLPEQIRTFVRGGVVVSEIVEHAG